LLTYKVGNARQSDALVADWLADRVMQPTLRHAFRNTFTPTSPASGSESETHTPWAEAASSAWGFNNS
jgi:hypothetical protein